MKRRIITMTVCAAALAASVLSCKKETPASQPAETGDGISISVQGSIEDLTPADGVKATAGSVVRVKWAENDAVYVYDGANYLGKLKVSLKEGDDRYAFLTNDGTVNAPQSGTTELTLIYASGAASAPEISGGKISIDLSAQDGEDFPFVLYGTLDYASGAETIEDRFVPFEFATSALKVNCTCLGTSNISEASLSGVNTKCELSISKDAAPTVSGTTPGTITRSGTFTVSDGSGTVTFGVAASAESNFRTLELTDANDTYASTFAKAELEIGKSLNTVCAAHRKPTAGGDCVFIAGVWWANQNLATSESGKAKWKPGGSEIAVPGTDGDKVIIGDYFQWGAYQGYCGNSGDSDKGLLVYTEFSCLSYDGSQQSSAFTFKSDKSFANANAPYYSGSTYTKYTKTSSSDGDGKNVLEYSDDVASIILGGNWRLPRKEEFEAMKAATYWVWDADDKGYYVYTPYPASDAGKVNSGTGTYVKTEALLFFPAAGNGFGSSLRTAGTYGYYWSSTLYTDLVDRAFRLYFDSGTVYPPDTNYRYVGGSVRPVSD